METGNGLVTERCRRLAFIGVFACPDRKPTKDISSLHSNSCFDWLPLAYLLSGFINKMRRLQGIRKMILIEEAWL
jgi:hypothetical protein